MAKKRNVYRTKDGTRVPGVTTITGILDKPALIWWAAGKATEYVEERWEPEKAFKKEEIEIILKDAKSAHNRAKVKAGDFGSNIHEIVESYIGGQLHPNEIKDKNERKALENFIIVTEGWVWVGAEIIVINEDLKYGGTADGGAHLPGGVPILADVKTGSGVYPEADIQISMYAAADPVDKNLREFWKKMREKGEGRILHFNQERLTWEVLEREMTCHYPFIPHFRQCYEWKKQFASK